MPSVLITGANRGIGLEFAKQYAANGWTVFACCRSPNDANELAAIEGDVRIHQIDVADRTVVEKCAVDIAEPLDVLVANAGVGGKEAGDFGALNYDVWRDVLIVNLFGAVATAEAFAGNVKKAKGKIALITSKMGSIDDASGGMMAYRTSKTALNMAGKVMAAALAGEGVAVGLFHPGWVETDMGGPSAPVKTPDSVSGLRREIDRLEASETPPFRGYDGADIAW